MEKFTRTFRGYDPEEVNKFVDQVIARIEFMVNELKNKDKQIESLQGELKKIESSKVKLEEYDKLKSTLESSLLMANKSARTITSNAYKERDLIVDSAKKNASIIVNNALLKSEKIEHEAVELKRNVSIFKQRLKSIIEAQLKLVEELDDIEL